MSRTHIGEGDWKRVPQASQSNISNRKLHFMQKFTTILRSIFEIPIYRRTRGLHCDVMSPKRTVSILLQNSSVIKTTFEHDNFKKIISLKYPSNQMRQ